MREVMRRFAQARGNAQRGDTLVEVLAAIVIVATVIGGAYTGSNKSLQSTRSAQERQNALKLSESQIEQLKSQIASDPTKIFGVAVPTKFCLSSDTTGVHVWDFTVAAQKVNCVLKTNKVPTTSPPPYT